MPSQVAPGASPAAAPAQAGLSGALGALSAVLRVGMRASPETQPALDVAGGRGQGLLLPRARRTWLTGTRQRGSFAVQFVTSVSGRSPPSASTLPTNRWPSGATS